MKNNIVVMNLSGIYEKENFYKDIDSEIINCQDTSGTNCYCDDNGKKEIAEKIKDFAPDGIHFIDGGNYHYISKFWTDKIKKDFNLFVFDHHTDMKESMFLSLLSCGSWVKEVLDTNNYIKKVFLIGPSGKYVNQIAEEYRTRVVVINEDDLKNKDISHLAESLDIKEPVYISIDKDILSEKVIKTNWDQGDITLKELEIILKDIMDNEKVIGVDICGEPEEKYKVLEENKEVLGDDEVNKELMELALNECSKEEELIR